MFLKFNFGDYLLRNKNLKFIFIQNNFIHLSEFISQLLFDTNLKKKSFSIYKEKKINLNPTGYNFFFVSITSINKSKIIKNINLNNRKKNL